MSIDNTNLFDRAASRKRLSPFTLEQLTRAIGRPITQAEGLRLEAAASALGRRMRVFHVVGTVH